MRENIRIARAAAAWQNGIPSIADDVINLTDQGYPIEDGEWPEPDPGACETRFGLLVDDDEDANEQSLELFQCEREAGHGGTPHVFHGSEWVEMHMGGTIIGYVKVSAGAEASP